MARLKGAKRQNNQLQLAFEEATTSEARSQSSEGTEASVAECSAESLAPDEQWMERICQRENLWQALKRLRRNGGSPGIDGIGPMVAQRRRYHPASGRSPAPTARSTFRCAY